MTESTKRLLQIIITIIIIAGFAYFLVISPLIQFKKNENKMLEAAKRYYELNPTKLPTGKRLSTITLKELYKESYLKEDLYTPLTTDACSINNSWVKVKQVDGEYKYYAYLECGVFKSSSDHTGPKITLKGDKEITLNKGEEYKEPGVEKVYDATDGNMDIKDVEIDSSNVDTSKTGTYTVTYTATDSFKNKTVVERKIKVIQKLKETVKEDTDKDGIYKGIVTNNYITFSGLTFRIVGLDGDNVQLVSDIDLANVNYSGIDEWLNNFYNLLTEEAQKLIIEKEYCTGTLKNEEVETNKSCISKTKKRKVYILSNKEINSSVEDGGSYLLTPTISWTANSLDSDNAWASKDIYNMFTDLFSMRTASFSKDYNFGIKPLITIKGDILITSGDGSIDDPYSLDESPKAKAGDYLNTRHTGEYITYSGYTWRIISTETDGTIKVIADDIINLPNDEEIGYTDSDTVKKYNPTKKGNVGYIINQRTSDTVDEKYFITKEIEVPIYKTIAKYNKEDKVEKYKVKFAAPNMYEIFSAYEPGMQHGYWLLNSSLEENRKYFISNNGVVFYDLSTDSYTTYIRPVGYLHKNCKIISGDGTIDSPYKIKK